MTIYDKLEVLRGLSAPMKVRTTAMFPEFSAFSEGMALIPSRAIKALCVDVHFPIKGLKLVGLFFVKPSLIDRSNSSRIFGARAYIAEFNSCGVPDILFHAVNPK